MKELNLQDLQIPQTEGKKIVLIDGQINQELSCNDFASNFIHIDKNFKNPIHIIHIFTKINKIDNLIKIKVDKNLNATILQTFIDLEKNKSLNPEVHTKIFMEENSTLTNVKYINLQNTNLTIDQKTNMQSKSSKVKSHNLYILNNKAKLNLNIDDYLLENNNEIDTFVNGILKDKSSVNANLLSHSIKGIENCVSNQQHKVLQLSDDVKIHTQPDLEVFTEGVEALHGFATTQMDLNQKFFLNARAIPSKNFDKISEQSFINNWINNIDNTKLKESLSDFLIK